jgi:hypothetical protein
VLADCTTSSSRWVKRTAWSKAGVVWSAEEMSRAIAQYIAATSTAADGSVSVGSSKLDAHRRGCG